MDNHAAFHHNERGAEHDPPLSAKKCCFFVLGQVKQEVKYGPVVIRWAQCNRQSSTYSPVIYSLIKKLENNKIETN